MKHWTSDVILGVGVGLIAAGVALATEVHVWGGVVCVALGVVLLLALRALEAWQATAKAADVAQAVSDLTAKVKVLDAAHAKTAEDASTALRAVRSPAPTKGPAY